MRKNDKETGEFLTFSLIKSDPKLFKVPLKILIKF